MRSDTRRVPQGKAVPSAASHPIQLGRNKIPEGVTMPNLENALQQLREERSRTRLQVQTLDKAISVIESLDGTGVSRKSARPTRIVSAASRRKMARAQRARWARVKTHNVVPIAAKRGKHTISAAGRRRIAAAQRARWAKVRAAKK